MYRIFIIIILLYFISFLSKAFVLAQPVTSPGNSNVFVIITRRCSRSKSQLYFVGFFIFSSFGSSTSTISMYTLMQYTGGTMSMRECIEQYFERWKNSAITLRNTLKLQQVLKSNFLKKKKFLPSVDRCPVVQLFNFLKSHYFVILDHSIHWTDCFIIFKLANSRSCWTIAYCVL